jgi:hydrogenase 3 maturation protease
VIKKLEADLRNWLNSSPVKDENRRVAVLGVGSDLRADDVVGVLIAQRLRDICDKRKECRMASFIGCAAPENITGEITKFMPTHLIVIDAADLDTKPGVAKVLSADDIGGISFSTHQLPLKIVVDYIVMSCHCEVIIIGIQPGSLEIAKEPTAGVLKTADEVVEVLDLLLVK